MTAATLALGGGLGLAGIALATWRHSTRLRRLRRQAMAQERRHGLLFREVFALRQRRNHLERMIRNPS